MIFSGQKMRIPNSPRVGVADPVTADRSGLERYYRTAPVGLFVIDRELRYVRINEQLARSHGLPIEDHIGKSIYEVIPEVAPRLEPAMRQTLETGVPTVNAELTATGPAEPGRARHWMVSYYPVEDAEGAVVGLSGVVQDITRRKGEESKLREQLRFEALLAGVSRSFVESSAEQVGDQIEQNLARIAEHFEVDRATLARFSADQARLAITHSWAREGMAEMQRFDMMAAFPLYAGQLAAGEAVRITTSTDLPEGSPERSYAEREGVRAAVSVPTSVAGAAVCVIALGSLSEERQWCDDTVERLRLLGEIFALALNRVSTESALREANAEIERLNEQLRAENLYLREEIAGAEGFDEIVGESPSLLAALRRVEQVAGTDATALIIGETGTGKDLVAHAIHRKSERRDRPLITVNCSALPATLIESELFGHEKGAFTGADSLQMGRFELADGGSIFLDEIGTFRPSFRASCCGSCRPVISSGSARAVRVASTSGSSLPPIRISSAPSRRGASERISTTGFASFPSMSPRFESGPAIFRCSSDTSSRQNAAGSAGRSKRCRAR